MLSNLYSYFQMLKKSNSDDLHQSRKREGEWSSNYCKLQDSCCFAILRESILKLDLVIRLKERWNQFLGPKLSPKVPKLPKLHISQTARHRKLVDPSKWPQKWIYYGCSKICIPLRQPEVPKKCLFGVFLGLIKWSFKSFHITRTKYHIELADLLKWPKDRSFY